MKNRTNIKIAALLLVLCLGVGLMAVACDSLDLEENTSEISETTDTTDTAETGDNGDNGDSNNKTEETDPPVITSKPTLDDADMPTIGWDETVG